MENMKVECMVGQFLKKQAYIDLESPIKVMSRLNSYLIMSEGLKSRKKPWNPEKISNFIGRKTPPVKGKPFEKETGLTYDKDKGTVTFEKEGEKITFKMPHKMERIPSFIVTADDGDQEKTHFSNSLNLGPAYKRDESVTRAI
ncbi:hypothetical protein Tco_0573251 [Tanacetum coccineum]